MEKQTALNVYQVKTQKNENFLSEIQLENMLHALGIACRKGEAIKHGKIYRPAMVAYRNHFACEDDESWNNLVSRGLAAKNTAIGINYYSVSKDGISYLKSLGYRFKVDH